MSNKPIYVVQPTLPPFEEFTAQLQRIWDTKILTNGGPLHQELEKKLCDYLGVKYISLFNNCTIGLITALQAMNLKGEVITTPYSFIATAHSILWNNLQPVFVDVEPDTLNINPALIEAAITPETTAILAVHCYGNPCAVEEIQKIADKHGLKVIYDAAHAFGVDANGQSVLNYGDLSVLSFHATKVFNTFEGGAIVCQDAEMKKRIDRLKNFGIVDEVNIDDVGMNGKMSEANAAFGLVQLNHVDKTIQERQIVDERYRTLLKDVKGIHCVGTSGQTRTNYAYFPVLVQPDYPLDRDGLYNKLKEHNIFARRYFYPLISQFPMYRGYDSASDAKLPVASTAAREVLCLPMYGDLSEEQQIRITDIVKE